MKKKIKRAITNQSFGEPSLIKHLFIPDYLECKEWLKHNGAKLEL